jgi:hypothetical protein
MKYLLLILALILPAMAGREFVASSSQDGRSTITSLSTPITLAVWCWPKQNTAAGVMFSLNAADNGSERVQIYQDGTTANDPFGLTVVDSGGTSTAQLASISAGYSNTMGGSTLWAYSSTRTHVAYMSAELQFLQTQQQGQPPD